VKSAREKLEIINAYRELGSYRATAALCGTTHKTVRRIVERQQEGPPPERRRRARSTDVVADLIAERVERTQGRISAKRLLQAARAAGYQGSDRSFRRAVAEVKAAHRRQRQFRPWLPQPGSHLVIDWAEEKPFPLFCAILPWSRWRFVRFAQDRHRETVLALIAECLEEAGGVPATVLSDRMAGLRATTVANVVVPHPDYVRFALRYGFRPDFCEAHDPQSKGVVEHLVGYAQSDLLVPAGPFPTLADANRAARIWCQEVNGRPHSETCAVPQERLAREREALRALPSLRPPLRQGELRKVDRLACVRFGSARYSVPHALVGKQVELAAQGGEVVVVHDGREVARHPLVAPGEVSLQDAHYGGPARPPARAVRPRSAQERAFLALGPLAEQYLRQAAAAGTERLASELHAIVALEPAYGSERLLQALERALAFRRFRAQDVRAILEAGPQLPRPRPAGPPLSLRLPPVERRSLAAYALEALQ
jgi:transposase